MNEREGRVQIVTLAVQSFAEEKDDTPLLTILYYKKAFDI